MRYLVVLRGLPACGKSTFVIDHGLEPYTLSSDKYRLMVTSFWPQFSSDKEVHMAVNQKYNATAWKRLYQDLEFRMSNGEFTVVDATHLTKKSLDKYRKLCKTYFYHMLIVDFTEEGDFSMKVDLDSCIERDKLRKSFSIGESVIRRMHDRIEPVPKSIKTVTPKQYNEWAHSTYSPLNFDKYDKVHVIGDIHGCYKPLKEFFDKHVDILKDAIVFVGDYFDRGIQNTEVLRFLHSIQEQPNVFMCMGNHDLRILKFLAGEDVSKSTFYRKTYAEMCKNGVTHSELRSFLRHLIPCALFKFHDQNYVVSHTGIQSTELINPRASEEIFVRGVGTYDDMEKVCKEFTRSCPYFIQIFGHRNSKEVPAKINNNNYNLCGFPEHGGSLRALTIGSGKREPTIMTVNNIDVFEIPNDILDNEYMAEQIAKNPDKFKINDVPSLVRYFRGSKYVNEFKQGNISCFNFTKEAFYTDNWNTLTNKARGIFINTDTNKIVARSYDKFFLLDQYEYCTRDKFKPPFTVYEKYDGFLGILGANEGELLFCQKARFAPYGDFANLFKSKLEPYIIDKKGLVKFLTDNNCSLVFEVVLPKDDPHIMSYDMDMIVLLDVISNDIEYHKTPLDSEMIELLYRYFKAEKASDLWITTKQFAGVETDLSDETIDMFKRQPYTEGYVFTDADGKMFKLKTYEYEGLKIAQSIIENGWHYSEEDIVARYSPHFSKYTVDIILDELDRRDYQWNKGKKE